MFDGIYIKNGFFYISSDLFVTVSLQLAECYRHSTVKGIDMRAPPLLRPPQGAEAPTFLASFL